ncbi:hypothetical protein [Paenibacillus sp. CF384]|uniref:hypothetical protein n=1 Tax=Paenibacillus sp. CF384 TaxID=1884382 RepID=UPI0008974119|nr:hypothetical protein [Paenibacillus sp. CF384]SDX78357.1 hypothetical protein SAMN05518855_102170 [Paenibacillus sp. CF384]
MPIVLRHRITGEIACGMLRNVYDFAYYGALWWEDIDVAEQLAEHALMERDFAQPYSEWELLEVKEERLKLFNVKLNNNPTRRIVLEQDGTIRLLKS